MTPGEISVYLLALAAVGLGADWPDVSRHLVTWGKFGILLIVAISAAYSFEMADFWTWAVMFLKLTGFCFGLAILLAFFFFPVYLVTLGVI